MQVRAARGGGDSKGHAAILGCLHKPQNPRPQRDLAPRHKAGINGVFRLVESRNIDLRQSFLRDKVRDPLAPARDLQ